MAASGVDTATAKSIQVRAQTDERFATIASNASAYGVDGDVVQYKILNLALNDPEAIDYVVDFPSKYPQAQAQDYTDSVAKGTFPHLYQWDERWGYTVYSSTAFSITGCCPTALSMVYMGLTGKNDLSPADMAQAASEDGYETPYNGTDTAFLTTGAQRFGLTCEQIDIDADALTASLKAGQAIICNVGAGDFTSGSHFIVITGIDSSGSLIINDPYSSVRSNTTWDIDRVLGQCIGLYAYRA